MSDHKNPLIEGLKLPGRIFQLPSRGIFYHNGELADDVRDGEIHVTAMSALDEINMKNPDQLFSGQAVNSVFSQCVRGVKKPSELLSKDVDAIMLFLRAVTYGSSYEFIAKHTCESAKDHSYVADIDKIINAMKMVDPTVVDSLYTIHLSNGQVVKLRPNKYQQVLDLIKANESKKEITVLDQQNNMIMMLLGVIESVNDIKDPALITEWIKVVPSPMINRIAEKIENVNEWGSSLKWTCTCKDCNQKYEVELPINPSIFFTE
jgi:hypothetical protein